MMLASVSRPVLARPRALEALLDFRPRFVKCAKHYPENIGRIRSALDETPRFHRLLSCVQWPTAYAADASSLTFRSNPSTSLAGTGLLKK